VAAGDEHTPVGETHGDVQSAPLAERAGRIQVLVGGSYSSAVESRVESYSPPTTRTRPFLSRVAVRLARAVDMLAVAVQLLLDTPLTSDRCVVAAASRTGTAPSPSELEPEPEPSPGAVSASRAQVAGARYLILTTNGPLFAWMNVTRIERKPCSCLRRTASQSAGSGLESLAAHPPTPPLTCGFSDRRPAGASNLCRGSVGCQVGGPTGPLGRPEFTAPVVVESAVRQRKQPDTASGGRSLSAALGHPQHSRAGNLPL
jgi:hypothetical protein